ncbi:uncharacterized protein F4807DRAFT_463893 [Annulohypoxylon truncatum]|uniref:uncharacterized protein n=1 Tax=Annulohypoxylon truncatum TaxID=327061 RepID=UPI002008BA0F|nr:uncharacterized protein F4807DRAFT_463893 [Annulohypoxylon truncatum]KAI1206129.1 hypothetical protein F4807DRAFT_463893 [Annulohypoxylon truncatum]
MESLLAAFLARLGAEGTGIITLEAPSAFLGVHEFPNRAQHLLRISQTAKPGPSKHAGVNTASRLYGACAECGPSPMSAAGPGCAGGGRAEDRAG